MNSSTSADGVPWPVPQGSVAGVRHGIPIPMGGYGRGARYVAEAARTGYPLLAGEAVLLRIIGSTNAISMKEIFPLMQDDKMWLGAPFQSGNAYFYIPEGVDTSQYAKGVYDPETRKVKFRNCCWYTNLDFKLRHEWLILVKRYRPEMYPSYENLEGGININKVVEIPCDYSGLMGVPITFMSQYNPDQFEILGLSREMSLPGKTGMSSKFIEDYFAQGGTAQISEGHPDLCYYDNDGKCVVPYRRVIIRNRHMNHHVPFRPWNGTFLLEGRFHPSLPRASCPCTSAKAGR